MTTTRQRQRQAAEMRDERSCPFCGHRIGAHRGYPVSDCIAPDDTAPRGVCGCRTKFARGEATR